MLAKERLADEGDHHEAQQDAQARHDLLGAVRVPVADVTQAPATTSRNPWQKE